MEILCQDLEDVRSTMLALDDVRAAEIEMDMELGPVEECYAFLQRCGVAVPREEMERVDSLRYTFKNLQSQAVSVAYFFSDSVNDIVTLILQSSVQSHLVAIQPQFKTNLLESVEVYKHDLVTFSSSYTEVGLHISHNEINSYNNI